MDRAVADDHRHPVTRRRLERPLRNWMQATFRADYFRRLCGRQGLGLGFGGLVVGIRSHSRVPRCEKAEVLRRARGFRRWVRIRQGRSEEHTSELQSLMRISYAVFCLKKKIQMSIIISSHKCTYRQQKTI